ncbi:MAG: endo alpha-1,4 polygalactosaminidase [Thermus sp.]|uniref:endo alpha-1,4 polygalactosaminidase n=1 Tax=Thermus sp. TaxID=275 RepID=UPI003919848B
MKKAVWLLLSLLAWASAQVDPSHVAQAVRRTIQLGQGLAQWEGLPRYPVVLSNTFPAKPVSHEGYFSVAWDEENLYFLGVFQQRGDTVRAVHPQDHPEWWTDDTMELFLKRDAKDKGAEVMHLAANPRGTRFKAYTYTVDYRTHGRVEEERWILEWAIPFSSLKAPTPRLGEIWALKVGREHQAAGEYPLWPMGGDYHSPTNFGFLVFVDAPRDPSELAQEVAAYMGVEPPLKSRLQDIASYAVYYGQDPGELAKLVNFDLAILQPGLPRESLASLKANGVKVLAYLSLGEVEPKRDYGRPIPKEWILGTNPNWGSQFVDASQEGWQALMPSLAEGYLKEGYDGLFLDTLDTVDLYPQVGPGLVQIVRALRERFPEAILVQNRGFRLLPQTAEYLDAVMYENLSAMYSFKEGRYVPVESDPSPVLSFARRGLVVLALDYAPPEDLEMVRRCYVRARELGFVPYVSVIQLDRVFLHNP